MAKSENAYRGMCTNRACANTFGHWPEEAIPNFCPKCGAPVIESCTNCSKPVEELIENPFGQPPDFCMHCGEQLRHDTNSG
jgi:hypothetical protein